MKRAKRQSGKGKRWRPVSPRFLPFFPLWSLVSDYNVIYFAHLNSCKRTHRSVATNSSLFEIEILETALCYLCKTDKETLIHLFWECSVTKTFWARVHCFFVSIHLIPASHVLDIYECLGFRGEKDDILVSHCLLLARYYIYCCKFKNISPSIREYAQQLKYNLEIEKQISIVTDSQNKFQQKWKKILHAL